VALVSVGSSLSRPRDAPPARRAGAHPALSERGTFAMGNAAH